MSLVKFLKSKTFFKHLLLSVVVTLLLASISLWILKLYTGHGTYVTVPDYTGLTLSDIKLYRIGGDFEFVILDSVYDDSKPKGSIIHHDPAPNSKVKPHRKIYLTTISVLPEQVSIPDLVDLTLRQAISTLETYGLRAGKLEHVPDIALNAVISQKLNGLPVEPGTFVVKGSAIDLVVGSGIGTHSVPVPFLLGLSPSRASSSLHRYSLNIGAQFFVDLPDTLQPRVFRQHPMFGEEAFMRPGQSVDLWYKSSNLFNFDSLLQLYQANNVPVIEDYIFDTLQY
ncbi:MAG TPA: PASTA domain-containing protein [Bacteroidales bacterium]|nr:PASTA domain-containing protein [Bacteroidales bacterium]